MVRIAIAGAGKGGSALLELFSSSEDVRVCGITDQDSNACGLKTASSLGIPVFKTLEELVSSSPDIIINATGNPVVSVKVKEKSPAPVEVLEGAGARLLWQQVENHKRAKNDLDVLYKSSVVISKANSLEQVLQAVIASALELTETKAGSIALLSGTGMEIAAQHGFENGIAEKRWTPAPGGITKMILENREPAWFEDIEKSPLLKEEPLLRKGAHALLAAPLHRNGDTIGLIFLYDFSKREFTERHKSLIKLFSSQAAYAIEKFRLLHQLEESLSSLQCIFDDSQDMIIASNNDGQIVRYSKGGERILGYAQEEVLGKKVMDLYYRKEDRVKIAETLSEKGAIFNHETVLLRKDGTPVDISLTISRLKDKAGKIIGTVGVSKDITVEKRLRLELEELNRNLEDKVFERTRELERANKELKTANELKGRFIANASHELRTPLHSIIGFAEVLAKKSFGELNERQTKFAGTILTSGKHLLHLVNNILDLAKIEAGKAHLAYEKFSIPNTIEEVISVLKPLADRKMHRIEIKTEGVGIFNADKVKFKQVLYNLLSNAIKFTPDEGRLGVHVASFVNMGALPWAPKAQEFLKVSVWDTGPGIKPADRERIFDEFEQLDPSKNTEGTGLGLTLTKKLIELHGGHIEIKGEYGKGSIFDVYLPFSSHDEISINYEAPFSLNTAYPVKAADGQGALENGATILVVEDDLPTVELLTIHLTQAGYRVAHAYDGEEAIRKARELRPFVITLDIMLPKKDGWEVLQALKSCPETKEIPVIIHSMIENTELGFALGATDYLVKPVDEATLIDRLRSITKDIRKKHQPVSVLLITGDSAIEEYLKKMLHDEGFIIHSTDSENWTDLAIATKPNALIVDLEEPEKGFPIIEAMKQHQSLFEIPLFALTSRDFPSANRSELTGHVEKILRKDTLNSGELVGHLKNLEVLYPERAGLIEDVTKLFNSRYLKIRLSQEINRARRYNLPLVFMLVEIDDFEGYVAKKGEFYGNLALKKVSELLKKNIRGSDVLMRYKDSSFSLILTNTFKGPAIGLGKRFISKIGDYPFLHAECLPGGKLTISIGCAELKDENMDDLVLKAACALEKSKSQGKGKLEFFRQD